MRDKSDLANVMVRIEWLEVSQRPAGDTEDRIPSCLFTSHRHRALFLIHQLGKNPPLSALLPFSSFYRFLNKHVKWAKKCWHISGACKKSCKGRCQLGHFCVDAHGTEDLCGPSSRVNLPKGIQRTKMGWREWAGTGKPLDCRAVCSRQSARRRPKGKVIKKHSVRDIGADGAALCGNSLGLKRHWEGVVLHCEKLGLGSGEDLVIDFPRRFLFNTNRILF